MKKRKPTGNREAETDELSSFGRVVQVAKLRDYTLPGGSGVRVMSPETDEQATTQSHEANQQNRE